MPILPDFPEDKRTSKRFAVPGSALIQVPGKAFVSTIINLSSGGLLIWLENGPAVGTEVEIDLSVKGFSHVSARGLVVWAECKKVGIKFLSESIQLDQLLVLLEKEHSPWSSTA